MTPKDFKRMRVLLLIAGVLALLLAVNQTALYLFANAHLKEILQNGSAKLFGIFPVTESAAPANPNLVVAVVGALLSAVCFFGAHRIKKRHDGRQA